MSAHTPGPWREVDWNGEPSIIHDCLDKGYFDLIVTGPLSPANARLIAAAPDLLEALQLAIRSRWLSIDFEHNRTREACDVRSAICAAIAKAEGKPTRDPDVGFGPAFDRLEGKS